MRIAVDARMIGETAHGIGQYALLLLQHLGRLYRDDEFLVLANGPAAARKLKEYGNIHVRQMACPPFSPAEHYAIPLALSRFRPHLFHATSVAVPALSTGRTIITVHDLIPFILERHRLRNRLYEALVLRRAVRTAAAVITDSVHTRNDVLRLLRPRDDRVHVVYIGVEDCFFTPRTPPDRIREKYGIEGDYFLTLISRRPHKNPGVLLDAFRRFMAEEKRDVTLAIAGLLPEHLGASAAGGPFSERIKLLGYVADEDLPSLYRGALAFVFPSLYEGFGLPVLEAMAAGTMVLCSHAASLPEVLGREGLYFDPGDSAALAGLMARAFQERDLREREGARGREEARKFTWERCARQTYELYRQVAAGS